MRPIHFLLALLGFALGCAEANDGDRQRTAGYCEQLEAYGSPCGEPVGCEAALTRDCGSLAQIVAVPLERAAAECMGSLGAPMECLAGAVDQATSSAQLESFAQTFCLACDDGSTSCEQTALAGESDDASGRAGRIARSLDPARLTELTESCASDDGCGDAFEACAQRFLARALPQETAACLLDAIAERELVTDCSAAEGGDDDHGDDAHGDDGGDEDSGGSDDGGTDDDAGTDDGELPCNGELGCTCGLDAPCISGLVCAEGICSEPLQCEPDGYEANDTEASAYLVGPLGDADGYASTFDGSLDGEADIDWYQYEGLDELGALVNPYASASVLALRVCVYAECTEGIRATSVTCPEGTTQTPSPAGRPGCCAEGSDGFEIELACGWTGFDDDSAIVSMSVDGGELGVCQDYALSFHF
ncbi:MAG: hypothetical protein IAG13_01115 [Deltaproteobacteria bacterium]|nr:hypothetical protein [Nannocystaceae bacterium]